MIKIHLDNAQVLVPLTGSMEIADITGTTVTPDKVLSGYKFIGTDGKLTEGTYTPESYTDFDKSAF